MGSWSMTKLNHTSETEAVVFHCTTETLIAQGQRCRYPKDCVSPSGKSGEQLKEHIDITLEI